MVYLVSYDLNEPEKNYPAIINAIGRYAKARTQVAMADSFRQNRRRNFQ